jgi:hypothetical protein
LGYRRVWGFWLPGNDDGSTGFIDLTPIFGMQGINFFRRYYTGFYVNNNGSVTFAAASSSFTPSSITGSRRAAPVNAGVKLHRLAGVEVPHG